MEVAAARDLPPSFHPHDRPQPEATEMGSRLRQLHELRADDASPVRNLVAEMIGEVGSKHMVYLPDIMPCLLHLLNDETPAVARQAAQTGANLFVKVLQRVSSRVVGLMIHSNYHGNGCSSLNQRCPSWHFNLPAMKESGYWLLSLLRKLFLCTPQILISHQIHQTKLQKIWDSM